jgi:PTS system beta-glucosides-specific IIC component
MADYRKMAEEILQNVGGSENVADLFHCATRLRFTLKDENKADMKKLEQIEGVWGCAKKIGQLQVIIGQTVSEVYDEICAMTGIEKKAEVAAEPEDAPAKKNSVVNAIFDVMTACFNPIIPAFAGAGIIKGLLTLCSTYGWIDSTTGVYTFLNAAGDAVFYFLPFVLAATAAKKFKTDQVLAIVLAGIYMYPNILNNAGTQISVLGIPTQLLKYSSTVLPILLSVWVMSYVYNWIYKHTVEYLRVIVVPIVVLLVMTPLSLMVFGPIGYYIGIYAGKLFSWLFDVAPLIAGLVVGATRPFVVLTGMHMAISPVMINNIATLGYDMIGPVNCVATMAAAGMCFGTFLRAKKAENKASTFSAFISAFIGITEPALYGVAFRFKKPLYACMLGGGVSGAIVAVLGGHAVTYAMPSIISLPAYSGTIPTMCIGLAVSFVVSAVSAYMLGLDEDIAKDERALKAEKKAVKIGKKN